MKQFYCQEVCLSTLPEVFSSLCFWREIVFDNTSKIELYLQRFHSIETAVEDLEF
tara:strand:- start:366 stop:530 length:165 start_codon:yes stop_codon:yes gene_type:complete